LRNGAKLRHSFTKQLPHRTGICEILETVSEVYVNLSFSKYGDFGDVQQVNDWLFPIFHRYENDKRPVIMVHPLSGQVCTIYTYSDFVFASVGERISV
jgi:hypothetical protein